MERTVILIKPDAVLGSVVGEIITRLEKQGFRIVAAKFLRLPDDIVAKWYEHHRNKPYFPSIKAYMTSTPIFAMLWQGDNIIAKVREICGPTDSRKASKGTIRGDFGTDIQANAIHASENSEAAGRETDLMFNPSEIHEY
ncbi:nucleoside-diphosphate kinase [Candidatus Gottesmanbacteria bacterium]|nr:nucleoside-diphosphate kinase [Candidatus Gottesmanbacteria bacterium]